jgi:hypothetical protein
VRLGLTRTRARACALAPTRSAASRPPPLPQYGRAWETVGYEANGLPDDWAQAVLGVASLTVEMKMFWR